MSPQGNDLLEDETCRKFVLPALKIQAGWTDERIRREYQINDGKIRATARLYQRDRPLRADYVLEYADGLPIAVVEAKRVNKAAADGIEQAKRYAALLDVPFAYATNGHTIIEFDRNAGLLTEVSGFPSPNELWKRFQKAQGIADGLETAVALAPFDQTLRNWDPTPRTLGVSYRLAHDRFGVLFQSCWVVR